MDLTHITSRSLRRILSLSEQKDRLVKLVAEIETEVANVLSPAPAAQARKAGPASRNPKKSKPKTKRPIK